jgi:hydrogenase maturation protein HypF
MKKMLHGKINSPITTSMGRLFDGVASIIGLNQIVSFEGQAAMQLEFAARESQNVTGSYSAGINLARPAVTPSTNRKGRKSVETPSIYPSRHSLKPALSVSDGWIDIVEMNRFDCNSSKSTSCIKLDWSDMIKEIVSDLNNGVNKNLIAMKFHNTCVEWIVHMANLFGQQKVVLSGGCFQNSILLTKSILRLREEGFNPYWHHQAPTNDGGIALGQLEAARLILGRSVY